MMMEEGNNIDICDTKKRTRNRLKKSEKYGLEREKLINDIEKLIGLTENIKGVLLHDLENNDELKKYLEDNIELIKRIYKHSNWNYFNKNDEEREIVSLLKSIFKSEKYQLTSKRKLMTIDGVKKQYNYIFFMKDVHLLVNSQNNNI
jgi:hypothetical protein